jgi:CheY-like chemotaxis protein
MKQILLVEDLDSDAELFQQALRRAGIRNPLRRCVTGEEAFAHLKQAAEIAPITPPSTAILVLDLKLPGMSGFDIIEKIRHWPAFAKALRIVLTNADDSKSIRRAYNLGAHSFLTKPVQQSDLRELVGSFPQHWEVASAAIHES